MTKNADSAFKSDGPKKYSSTNVDHIITLGSEPESVSELNSLNAATFSLRTQPGDADSPTFKFAVRKLTGSENARSLIQWYLAVPKIFAGLAITQYPPGIAIVLATLEGTPTHHFQVVLAGSRSKNEWMLESQPLDQRHQSAMPSLTVDSSKQATRILHISKLLSAL